MRDANQTYLLLNEDGNAVSEPDHIKEHFLRFYRQLLGETMECEPVDNALLQQGRRVSPKYSMLEGRVTKREV